MRFRITAIWTALASLLSAAPAIAQEDSASSSYLDSGSSSAGSSSNAGVDLGINAPANYRLVIGDSIVIRVENEEDATIKQTIDVNGEIRPVYIERVQLADLTVYEAEELIRQRYIEEKYFRDPVVRISIADYNRKYVFLQGEFQRTQPFAIPAGLQSMKVSELITFAGGLTQYARKNIDVIRADGTKITVNADAVLKKKRNAPEDIPIFPGDTLIAYERWL